MTEGTIQADNPLSPEKQRWIKNSQAPWREHTNQQVPAASGLLTRIAASYFKQVLS